jgi:hypothetical protein
MEPDIFTGSCCSEYVDCVLAGFDAVWCGGSIKTIRWDFLLLLTNCYIIS